MKKAQIFKSGLSLKSLSNAEWESFLNFFDPQDSTGEELKKKNPILYRALCTLKRNQERLEIINYLALNSYGDLEKSTDKKTITLNLL